MRGLVVGFGLSGFWAGMLFLRNLSDKLYIYDDNLENLDQSRVETIKNYAITVGKRVEFVSKFELSFMDDVDLVIVSPGIPPTHSILDLTRNKGIPLVGELEFAFQFLDRSKVNIVGITGTNGKTTTTSLVNHGFRSAGFDSEVGGNIGNPLSKIVFEDRSPDFLVLELSSFQLLYTDKFRVDVGVILNIDYDHMDYHRSFTEYAESKLKILRDVKLGVYNLDDPVIRDLIGSHDFGNLRLKSFSTEREADSFVSAGSIFIKKDDGTLLSILDLRDLSTTALFNLPNILASILVFDFYNLPVETIRDSITSFNWLPHRLEFVGVLNGVEIYNDSKATNPHAVKHALSFLSRFGKPIVLILGGSGKKLTFESLVPYFDIIKGVVCYGDAGEEIEMDLRLRGYDHIFRVWDFREAVNLALSIASGGDILLLSPGCASFDQFKSYAERGDVFKRLILQRF